jgi:hypothetical protein
MALALKQHPLFASATNLEVTAEAGNGQIRPDSLLATLLRTFEEASRNYTGVNFDVPAAQGKKKILITGFDPFLLDDSAKLSFNRYRINPSDIVVSALHGEVTPNGKGFMQAMIFPVRYQDFDGSPDARTGEGPGVVERYIEHFIKTKGQVDMIVTISQGRPRINGTIYFDVEKYATATRSGYVDNLSNTRPVYDMVARSLPPLASAADNLEWLTTTLPAKMVDIPSNPGEEYVLHDAFRDFNRDADNNAILTNNQRSITPIQNGELPRYLRKPRKQQLAEGSGGAYLSNEIFYRVARMRQQLQPKLPTGHLHIPVMESDREPGDVDTGMTYAANHVQSGYRFALVRRVITVVKDLLNQGVATL